MPALSSVSRFFSRSKGESSQRTPTLNRPVDVESTTHQSSAAESAAQIPATSAAQPSLRSSTSSSLRSSDKNCLSPTTTVRGPGSEATKEDSFRARSFSHLHRRDDSLGCISTVTADTWSTAATTSSRTTSLESEKTGDSLASRPSRLVQSVLPGNGSAAPRLWKVTGHNRWSGHVSKVLKQAGDIFWDSNFTCPHIALCSTSEDEALAGDETMVLAIVLQPRDMVVYQHVEPKILQLCQMYWADQGPPPVRFWVTEEAVVGKPPKPSSPSDASKPVRKVSFADEVEGKASAGEGAGAKVAEPGKSDAAGFLVVPS